MTELTASRLDDRIGRSPSLSHALSLAQRAHEGQTLRFNLRPYLEHPLAVAATLHGAGFGDPVLAAALLHDVVEDSEVSASEIRERFGEATAELVAVLTEEPAISSYEHRKAALREQVAGCGRDAAAIYAADKLANVRELRAAYGQLGESAGESYETSLESRIELWETDLEMVAAVEPAIPFAAALAEELEGLRQARES